ncbi:hypothetical protein [Arsukibacterium indicum]|uniref:Uncharacterized protein n=1 Tax=Arsukibacterium indicum TaxID=2848612 RepID=A0ABS6ML97_9GAMM|nr:hypothetical protein [Arsukibacterium indicum]MBV2129139.1 hypothetical protein [Arsukibacterium indicum]
MTNNINLTFWDIFTYLLVGLPATAIISLYIYLGIPDSYTDDLKKILLNISDLTIIFPLLVIFVGAMIEPLANFQEKIRNKIVKKLVKDEITSRTNILEIVKKKLPEGVGERHAFRFCKAIVIQKTQNTNIEIFLARFGMYRSIAFIFLSASPLVFMINISCTMKLLYLLIIFSLYEIYYRRCKHFLKLLENEVYYNFIALNSERKQDEKPC